MPLIGPYHEFRRVKLGTGGRQGNPNQPPRSDHAPAKWAMRGFTIPEPFLDATFVVPMVARLEHMTLFSFLEDLQANRAPFNIELLQINTTPLDDAIKEIPNLTALEPGTEQADATQDEEECENAKSYRLYGCR